MVDTSTARAWTAPNPEADVLVWFRNPAERLGMASLVRAGGRSVVDEVHPPLNPGTGTDPGDEEVIPLPGPGRADSTVVIVALRDVCPVMRAAIVRAADSSVRILVLVEDVTELGRLAGVNCSGFLLSRALDVATLGAAIDQVLSGEVPMPQEMAQHLLATITEPAVRTAPIPVRLTPREQETLVLLVDGLSNKQIARRLGVSNHGAKRLVANVIAKLDCTNRTAAVSRALREGVYERYTAAPAS